MAAIDPLPRLLTGLALAGALLASGCASTPPPAETPTAVVVTDAAPALAAEDMAPTEQAPAPVVTADGIATAPLVAPAADPAPDGADADFDAIYGGAGTPGSDATAAAMHDPWEPMNRRVHAFNNAIDRTFMRPVARAYTKVLPQPVRTGVSNLFDNLAAPLAFGNLVLQGRPREAVETLGRFVVNTIGGIGGLFDPATKALKMHRHGADFGRTLARWGWRESRYLELPFLGPRTVRDAVGAVGDISMAPMTYVEHDRTRLSLEALWLVDVRSGLLSLDDLRDTAPDEYVLTRDAWLARRRYLVEADRSERDEGNEALPAYLLEDVPEDKPEAPAQPKP